MSSRSKRRTPSTTNTGATLGRMLSERGLTQGLAASAANTSRPYFNQVLTGTRKANAAWLDLVAEALGLSDEERVTLHRAGAKDQGFRLD